MTEPKLAVITGASSGIGFELARCAATDGCQLVIVAETDEVHEAANRLATAGATVQAMQLDLESAEARQRLWETLSRRRIDYLMANAGKALGQAFHEQDFDRIERLIELNVWQTTWLVQKVARQMTQRKEGNILISGSIGAFVPGPYDAVYNATKAYLVSLSYALRDELRDTGVAVTCLMPGPTETPVFERADMEDTPIGRSDMKGDPAEVAKAGYAAMKEGSAGVVPGAINSLVSLLAGVVPRTLTAAIHRKGADPAK